MLSLLTDNLSRTCDGLTRRDLLSIGSIGLGGLTLPGLLRHQDAAAAGAAPRIGKARSVIVLYLNGGPSQLETWDMKPEGPSEIRGTFRPIDTNVAGIRMGEHLPRMAKLADKCAIIRSMTHKDRGHPRANYIMMTGDYLPRTRAGKLRSLSRSDRPHFGSAVANILGSRSELPPFVLLPQTIQPTGPTDPHPGQFAGFLGATHDPYLINSDPNLADYQPGPLSRHPSISSDRFANRGQLLETLGRRVEHLEQSKAVGDFGVYYRKAFDLISSPDAQSAFDINAEPAKVRDRYGRHAFGQSALLARRMIEAGVRLVHVNWIRIDNGKGGQGYDSHSNHLKWSKESLLPPTDAAFSSLVEDLDDRGLLDETLVLMMGEFGRTPRFNKNGGRDHWPDCFSLVMAGGGIRGGLLYGTSDKMAASPISNPVSPADLLATVYHALGIDPHRFIYDQFNRPNKLTEGRPVTALM